MVLFTVPTCRQQNNGLPLTQCYSHNARTRTKTYEHMMIMTITIIVIITYVIYIIIITRLFSYIQTYYRDRKH